MPTWPLSPAKATSLYSADLAKCRSAKEQHFNCHLLKIPCCLVSHIQHSPMGIHPGNMAQEHVLGFQQKYFGTTVVQEQVFMSCRAFQRWASLFHLLSRLTVDTGKPPCPKKAHVQRTKGKGGKHRWRRTAFQHNSPQISLMKRVALAKESNCQKALAGWEPTSQPTAAPMGWAMLSKTALLYILPCTPAMAAPSKLFISFSDYLGKQTQKIKKRVWDDTWKRDIKPLAYGKYPFTITASRDVNAYNESSVAFSQLFSTEEVQGEQVQGIPWSWSPESSLDWRQRSLGTIPHKPSNVLFRSLPHV